MTTQDDPKTLRSAVSQQAAGRSYSRPDNSPSRYERAAETARPAVQAGSNSGGGGSQPRFRFEKLGVWQDALLLSRQCMETLQKLRAEGQTEWAARFQEDLWLVSASIAEGASRGSDQDFNGFLDDAQGRLIRLASHLYVAIELAWLSANEAEGMLDLIDRLVGRIFALRRSMSQRQEANGSRARGVSAGSAQK
ncbi:MAG TPA: four helix bundle protein [Candidatus Paceibacterota bacterium]|nr:four helix bundle protein [Verrucomicrobiota bacterium]HRY50015.1 four helix bundle protein [Candidatus Paceibacterota bacterium]HSA01830.1 four helix bundle protein [Candidatus Paceibacterota bacterium]